MKEKIVHLFNCNHSNSLNIGLLIFRLTIGLFMLTHGWAKLSNFETLSTGFPDPIALGSNLSLILIILAEFGCSLLIITGLFTRLATLPLIFGMFVAGFIQHAGDPFAARELALLYLVLYISLALMGAGKYSLDYVIYNKIKK